MGEVIDTDVLPVVKGWDDVEVLAELAERIAEAAAAAAFLHARGLRSDDRPAARLLAGLFFGEIALAEDTAADRGGSSRRLPEGRPKIIRVPCGSRARGSTGYSPAPAPGRSSSSGDQSASFENSAGPTRAMPSRAQSWRHDWSVTMTSVAITRRTSRPVAASRACE